MTTSVRLNNSLNGPLSLTRRRRTTLEVHDAVINVACIWAHDFLMDASSTPKLPVLILIRSVVVVVVVACWAASHFILHRCWCRPLYLALVVFTYYYNINWCKYSIACMVVSTSATCAGSLYAIYTVWQWGDMGDCSSGVNYTYVTLQLQLPPGQEAPPL